eukprot:2618503-Amphidinium_carterae.1
MVSGRSRVRAGLELASSVKVNELPLEAAEVSRLLRDVAVPPAGERIIELLKPEEAIFLAMGVHWGSGKSRKLKRTIALGDVEIDL